MRPRVAPYDDLPRTVACAVQATCTTRLRVVWAPRTRKLRAGPNHIHGFGHQWHVDSYSPNYKSEKSWREYDQRDRQDEQALSPDPEEEAGGAGDPHHHHHRPQEASGEGI